MIKNFLVAAGLLASVTSIAQAQTTEKYQNVSRQLAAQAGVAMKADKAEEAQLLFERALVADPANTDALLGLGKAHELQGRLGRSLKYYRQALEIEPNDKKALKAQALAFLKRDNWDRADANRAKLARLCPNGCEALNVVETALEAFLAKEKGPQTAEAKSDG